MKQHQQHLIQSISIQIISRQTDPDHHPGQPQLPNSIATLYHRTGTAWMAMHNFTTANIQFHVTQYALSSIPPLTAPTTMPEFYNNSHGKQFSRFGNYIITSIPILPTPPWQIEHNFKP